MTKIVLELDNKQIERLMEQFPEEFKTQLIKKWEDKLWGGQMEEIIKRIDERRKKYPVKDEEIIEEIEKGRQEYYDQSSS